MASRKRTPAQDRPDLTPTLWTLAAIAVMAAGIYHLFYDETAIAGRSALLIAAIVVPGLLLFFWQEWSWRRVLAASQDPILVALSGAAALAVWPIAWWLMSLLDEEVLFEMLGAYAAPSIYRPINWEEIWTPLVLTDVVLVPLALMPVLWGGLCGQLKGLKRWQALMIVAAVFGVLGMVLYGQGIVGFFGYGLCGLIGAFVTLQTRTAWSGFAVHATFMYANLNFLDNLLREMVVRPESGGIEAEPYFGTKWLSLVLVASLIVVVLMQIIRFRSEEPESKAQSRPHANLQGWGAVAVMFLVCCFVVVDEIQRRA
ncbi:MAG: hypothetical protein GYB66_07320 [Chloroflexi bacterium]|nr:hypothetical protein [Chloroflexota bacterium]